MNPSSPRAEYQRRLDARQQAAAAAAVQDRRLSAARLVTFVILAIVAYQAWGPGRLRPAWVLAPTFVFVALLQIHDRVIAARRRAEAAVRHYRHGIDRIDGNWIGKGNPGSRFVDPAHPYASDLDLFGHGSVFELLCTARTGMGESTLASWLCAPASPVVVAERQAAVEELRSRIDLREDLELVADEVKGALDPDALGQWGAEPAVPLPPQAGRIGLALAVLTVLTLGGWGLGVLVGAVDPRLVGRGPGPGPFSVVLILSALYGLWLSERVERILAVAERPARALAQLARLLARIEVEPMTSPLLQRLRAELVRQGQPPSARIARLGRLLALVDSRRNQLFAPIAMLLLWSTQLAVAIEGWRRQDGVRLKAWLASVGTFEALLAIAGYAYEHPEDPFPTVDHPPVAGDGGGAGGAAGDGVDMGLDGEGLGHPLLPAAQMVRNDLSLGRSPQLVLISGSNMSGKSTFLRTVGVNLVLAQAGAPVRARRLRLSPLQLGASIRIADSLLDGTSKFYAEIRRLRQVMDLTAGELPVLFLLDEILHGTNSHDRAIGAEAVVRGLLARGACGLVTTHDLALARMVDGLGAQARNVHFEDRLDGGGVTFDYRLRDGVVTRSNALALMRAVGLDV